MTPTGPGSSSTAGPSRGWRLHRLADSRRRPAGTCGVAIVYLPLHRTQAVTVTEQTLTFGFRAASTDDPAEVPGLAAVADLDLMQARRHAAVLAGHLLAGDLAALRQAGDAAALRGLAAVEREWAARGKAAGRAATVRLRARPARQPAAGAGLPAGRTSAPRLAARRGTGSRPPGGDAGGGAGADDRAALRPAPGPLRVGRDAAHRAGHGRRHMGLPAAGPQRLPPAALACQAAR